TKGMRVGTGVVLRVFLLPALVVAAVILVPGVAAVSGLQGVQGVFVGRRPGRRGLRADRRAAEDGGKGRNTHDDITIRPLAASRRFRKTAWPPPSAPARTPAPRTAAVPGAPAAAPAGTAPSATTCSRTPPVPRRPPR